MNRVKIKVKQGEEISFGFTIKGAVLNQETNEYEQQPLDLTDYKIKFQVKVAPLEKVKPIIDKLIELPKEPSGIEPYTVGEIYDAENGKFYVHLTKEDTSHNTGEYYLIIALVSLHNDDIISSNCCNSASFIICEQ